MEDTPSSASDPVSAAEKRGFRESETDGEAVGEVV